MNGFFKLCRRRLGASALAGLVAALLVAGCGKAGDRAADKTTQVAARVNDDEISIHQINLVMQRQPGLKPEQTEAASRQILERLIDQEFAVQKAKELKLDREPRVMQAIEAARDEIIARAYGERVADGAPKPSAEEMQAYYDAKPALFRERRVYTLQEVLVQAGPEQVEALREKVQGATSFKEVTDFIKASGMSARASQSTSAAESLPMALVDRFAKMKTGQGMVMPTNGGARIVIVANAQTSPIAFEQARPVIEQAIGVERKRAAVDAELKALRKSGKVEYLGRFAAAPASAPARPPTAASGTPSGDELPAAVDSGTVSKGLAGLK